MHRDWNHLKCLRKPHPWKGLGQHLPPDPEKELHGPEGWPDGNMKEPRVEVDGRIYTANKNQIE